MQPAVYTMPPNAALETQEAMFVSRGRAEQIEALETKAKYFTAEKHLLEEKLGISDSKEIIDLVHSLEQANDTMRKEISALQEQIESAAQKAAAETARDTDAIADAAMEPRELLTRITGFASKIKNLNGNIGSLEDQLNSLYAEREILEKELGVSDAKEIITMFRSLDSQLVTMYATRETFEKELGLSDAAEIVARFKRISQLASDVQREVSFK